MRIRPRVSPMPALVPTRRFKRSPLLSAKLALVARGVSTRTTVLALGGIQLRAESDRLHLASTDMELSPRASVE